MLYTFSQAHYDQAELASLLAQVQESDCVLLWQDGVLQAVKNPQLFAKLPHVFALENDVNARALRLDIPTVSLKQLVGLTENYFPQIAL